jgi:hypothetical protein
MDVGSLLPILRSCQAILDGREHGVILAQVETSPSSFNGCYALRQSGIASLALAMTG